MASGNARRILAVNLRKLRAEHGWSQEELAYQASLHRTFVAHVEREARNISLDNIERLAEALGVTPATLLMPDEDTKEAWSAPVNRFPKG